MTRDQIRAKLRHLASPETARAFAEPEASERPARSDFDLTPGGRLPGDVGRTLKPAGVLVPLIDRTDGPTILLTQRTAHLHKHAGQVSFPGGGMEEQDPDLLRTALRETEEEIGLQPDRVDILGRLETYETSTAYGVVPFVGWIRPPLDLHLDTFEVAEAFEVPLSFVLDRRNHRRDSAIRDGRRRYYYVLPYDNRFIWGATAGMLVNFADVLLD